MPLAVTAGSPDPHGTEVAVSRHRSKAAVTRVGLLLPALAATARAAAPSTAPAATVDNPQYAMWAPFKPGSSATMVGDVDAGPQGKVHLEVTQTLRSVTPDVVTLAQVTRVTMGGQVQPVTRPLVQMIPAKQARAEMVRAGSADAQAMGRTFTCRVYHVGGGAAGPPGTAYAADGVPGGVVKLVVNAPDGTPITFVLSATDVK